MKNKINFRKYAAILLLILFIAILFCLVKLGWAMTITVFLLGLIHWVRKSIRNATPIKD